MRIDKYKLFMGVWIVCSVLCLLPVSARETGPSKEVTQRLGYIVSEDEQGSVVTPNTTALPTLASSIYLQELYASNDGLPNECRRDMCDPANTTDYKGTFMWEWTIAGTYATIPCPNGVEDPNPEINAHRPCYPPYDVQHSVWKTYMQAYWGEPVTDHCRWSSETTNTLMDLKEELLEVIDTMIDEKSSNISSVIDILKDANVVLRFARDVTPPDVTYVASIVELSVQSAIEGVYLLERSIGKEVVKLADKLLEVDTEVLEEAEDACLSIASTLEDYGENVELGILDDTVKHFTKNVYVEVYQTGWEINQMPGLKWLVHRVENDSSSEPVISISIGQNESSESHEPSSDPVQTGYLYRSVVIVYYSSKFFTINQHVSLPDDTAVVYVHVYQDGVVLQDLPVFVTFYHTQSTWVTDDVVCSAASITSDKDVVELTEFRPVKIMWSPLDCALNVTNHNFTTCLCEVLDLMAVIWEVVPTPTPTGKAPPPDPMAFIGIPYSRGLSITSYVGYAISLLSLSFTLITYAVFKQVRRGRPTLILMNLCVAELLLVVVLLTAVSFCHTQTGCRAANIIRVYFILVSMMWNGVEAVHMYLALVKVFTTYASHFMLKAGVIAWGVPMVYVVIFIAINVEYFDGKIIECTFACYLSEGAFFFVFFIPMLVIMVFNSVVFAMVLRVISRIYSNDKRKTKMSQLKGAIALFVLLGLTWSLGGAAVVNYNQFDSENPQITALILQGLFVVCVAFQGFFICVFHCLRYSDVRRHWMHLLRKMFKMVSPKRKRKNDMSTSADTCTNTPATCAVISRETFDTRL